MVAAFILAGLGVAAVGYAGRKIISNLPVMSSKLSEIIKNASNIGKSKAKFYTGGFSENMNKREAALILGISPNAPQSKIKDAHKQIMLLNHPDRGGSPYLASKINEAKDIMTKKRPNIFE